MIHRKRWTSLLWTGCFAVGTAQGAEPVLAWADALQEVIKNNPDLRAAQSTIDRASELLRASRGDYFPQIRATGSGQRSRSSPSDPGNSYSAGLSLSQNLFAGGTDRARVEQNEAAGIVAWAEGQNTRSQVLAALKTSYARLWHAQEVVRLTDSIALRRRDNARLIGLRYEAGREHKGSFLRGRAALRLAEFEQGQSKRSLRVAQRGLSGVLGWDDRLVSTVGELWTPAAPPEDPPFSELTQKTPDHQKAEAQLRAAEAERRAARGDRWPRLDASAGINRRGTTTALSEEGWSWGADVSWPLFTGGSLAARVSAAGGAVAGARSTLRSTALRVVENLESAHANWLDAIGRRDVQREFLNAAEVRAEVARGQYSSGLLSFEDWDAIENDLINNQKAWLDSLRTEREREAAWDVARGTGDFL